MNNTQMNFKIKEKFVQIENSNNIANLFSAKIE